MRYPIHCRPSDLLRVFIFIALLSSCTPRPFVPQQTGREYGAIKMPWMVCHITEKNEWSLNRVDHHNIFKKIVCFDYICRRMIGKNKNPLIITKKEYIKQIKKNAKRGFFNTPTPTIAPKKITPDTLKALNDTTTVVAKKVVSVSQSPMLKADSLITLNEFLFEINSYTLRVEHFSELDGLGNYLKTHPTLVVNISGHTDSTGDERNNLTLSTRRAEAVAKYIVSKGVDYGKVTYQGLGSSRPIMSNDNEEGRSRNRRVEILIQDPKK